uniref:Cysteine desulfurase, mitochondrial n=1 Tax=Macrostomum lignano TaxID=282301 RepID=A0A1I8FRU7_9PLAT
MRRCLLPLSRPVRQPAHSRSHALRPGRRETAVEKPARSTGWSPAHWRRRNSKEIVFNLAAPQSLNNIAIKGVAPRFYKSRKRHLITSQTEHKCVLDSCRALESREDSRPPRVPALPFAQAATVTYLPVKPSGLLDLASLESAIPPRHRPGSTMKSAFRQPVEKIGALSAGPARILHTDAAQAVGKMQSTFNAACIDLMSISGHKLYGPKVSALSTFVGVARPTGTVAGAAAGQERGMRSGTCQAWPGRRPRRRLPAGRQEMAFDAERVDRAVPTPNRMIAECTWWFNGDGTAAYPGCVNLSFACVEGESLLMALKDVALSSGSACTSASLEPSYVLRAIGADEDLAHSSIRFGIGRFTTEARWTTLLTCASGRSAGSGELSPLWRDVQEGVDLKSIQWTQH